MEIIKRNGGAVELDKLMEELWRMCWKEHRTACTGWIGYEENGKIKHWCKQAWEILKMMEWKGIVVIDNKRKRVALR